MSKKDLTIRSTTNKEQTMTTRFPNITLQTTIKTAFASVIITMGGMGYYHFFNSDFIGVSLWLMIALFVVIEIAILFITTKIASEVNYLGKGMKVALASGILFMWIIATIGIDQTIWSLVEAKYNSIKTQKALVDADKQKEVWLRDKLTKYQTQLATIHSSIGTLEEQKAKARKMYAKKESRLRDVIYYNGKMCNNTDCLARKEAAQRAVELAEAEIKRYNKELDRLLTQVSILQQKIETTQNEIEMIVTKRAEFEKTHNVALENKHEEALIHKPLMEFFNMFGLEITTPERAYVLLVSLIVYPIYILYVFFVGYTSSQKVAIRKKLYEQKQAKKKEKDSSKTLSILLKKLLVYIIKTRIRKVAIKEVELIKEVEVEVEKVIYKDGKEIEKVEIEVPKIIDRPIVVEKVVEVPIIEKEFVIVPESIDLNELNKIAKTGAVPKHLKDIIDEIRETKAPKFTGFSYGQYKTA